MSYYFFMTLEQTLGLNKKEKLLYSKLGTESLSIAEIARRTDLPRMTSHYIIQRLFDRGILTRKKRNKQYLYCLVPVEKLILEILPQSSMSPCNISLPIKEGTGIALYHGFDQIYNLYKKICEKNIKKRVCTIQTTASTQSIYNQFDLESLDKIHYLMTKNKLIIEDIVEEDFFDPIREKFKNNFNEIMKPFLDRQLVTYVIPKNCLSFTNDMVLFKDVVVFIDWPQEIAIEIKNEQIVRLCFDFFELLKDKSHKMQFANFAKSF